jgi:hypothetical protein
MNPVKRALDASDDYAKQSTWLDFALIKICLCALGVMIGVSIPRETRKPAFGVAAATYGVTFAAIMTKFLPILKENMEKE